MIRLYFSFLVYVMINGSLAIQTVGRSVVNNVFEMFHNFSLVTRIEWSATTRASICFYWSLFQKANVSCNRKIQCNSVLAYRICLTNNMKLPASLSVVPLLLPFRKEFLCIVYKTVWSCSFRVFLFIIFSISKTIFLLSECCRWRPRKLFSLIDWMHRNCIRLERASKWKEKSLQILRRSPKNDTNTVSIGEGHYNHFQAIIWLKFCNRLMR